MANYVLVQPWGTGHSLRGHRTLSRAKGTEIRWKLRTAKLAKRWRQIDSRTQVSSVQWSFGYRSVPCRMQGRHRRSGCQRSHRACACSGTSSTNRQVLQRARGRARYTDSDGELCMLCPATMDSFLRSVERNSRGEEVLRLYLHRRHRYLDWLLLGRRG